MPRPFRAFACALLLALVTARAVARADVQVLDVRNKSYAARTVALDAEGRLALTLVDGSAVRIPCDEVAEIAFPRTPGSRKPAQLAAILTNRDLLSGDLAAGTKSSVTLKSPDLGLLEVRFEQLAQLTFTGTRTAGNPPEPHADEDCLWRASGDTDVGVLAAIDTEGVRFQSSLFKKEVLLPLSEVAAIYFSQLAPAPAEPDSPLAIVECARGSRITGKLTALRETGATLETLYGNLLNIPLGAIASIFFKNGRCVYLSDLEPARVVEHDYHGLPGPDGAADGSLFHYVRDGGIYDPLRHPAIKGKEYRKGLTTHAYCDLTYALDGKFKRFLATVAFEDQAASADTAPSPLIFRVLVDGKAVFTSDVVRWETPPLEIDLPLGGARELRLVCDFGSSFDVGVRSHGAWAGARLIR